MQILFSRMKWWEFCYVFPNFPGSFCWILIIISIWYPFYNFFDRLLLTIRYDTTSRFMTNLFVYLAVQFLISRILLHDKNLCSDPCCIIHDMTWCTGPYWQAIYRPIWRHHAVTKIRFSLCSSTKETNRKNGSTTHSQ